MVKNPPSNAGDFSLIPDWGSKIPHDTWQLSQGTTAPELCFRAPVLQQEKPLLTAVKTQCSQKKKYIYIYGGGIHAQDAKSHRNRKAS